MIKPIEYRIIENITSPLIINSDTGVIEGYPIVFNVKTKIGNYFYEQIDSKVLDTADLSDKSF